MIVSILVIICALLWLLKETDWLTLRLPAYLPEQGFRFPRIKIFINWLDARGLLALAGIIGPLLLIATDVTAASIQPDYSFLRQSMSSLAITQKGWIETIGFMLMGLMIESFTAGLYLNVKRRRGFGVATALLVFFGFGLLVIGSFHTNEVGTPMTLSSTVHMVTAYSVFALFPIALVFMLSSIRNDPRWQGMFLYTVITISLAVLLAACQPFFTDKFHYYGAYERIMVLNAISWLVAFAVRLLMLSILG